MALPDNIPTRSDSLGRRLAWMPGDELLAGLFHLAQSAHHKAGGGLVDHAGTDLPPIVNRPAPMASPRFECSPFDGPDSERLEADRVTTEEQMRRYAHHDSAEPQVTEMLKQKARANGPWKELCLSEWATT